MNRAAPIVAMLWESWRLTRVEAAGRLALGLVAGSFAMLLLGTKGATAAFWMLIAIHSMIWFSIAKLNGGRFADGYKPGFPLYLLFRQPVSTATIVGAAMAYDALSCFALYLVSAAALGLVFGQPLPLFSMTLCFVAYHLAYTCCQWSTRNRIVQWAGSFAFSVPLLLMLIDNVKQPLQVEFSPAENALFAAIGVVSIVLTVAGVARQRRGDSVEVVPQPKTESIGFPEWLINVFRFPCPTSSAARAQVWFELRSSALPILTIGLTLAILIVLLHALGIPFAPFRVVAVALSVLAVPIMVFTLGANAFGIRRKQARIYASAFEMTQAYGTAQMSALKLLVRTACVLIALIALGLSLWSTGPLLSAWGSFPMGDGDALPGWLNARQKLADTIGGLTWYACAAWTLVATIAVAGQVAWRAAAEALRVRHPRLVSTVQWVPVAWSIAAMLIVVVATNEIVPEFVANVFLKASVWVSGAALVFSAIYLLRRGLTERMLTRRYAGGVLAISVVFAAALLVGFSSKNVLGVLWPAALIVTLGALAPWALNRARHA